MTATAFNAALPKYGGLIVAASSLLFGYSSLITVPYYGEISFKRPGRAVRTGGYAGKKLFKKIRYP
jgi:Na+/alanine symporter